MRHSPRSWWPLRTKVSGMLGVCIYNSSTAVRSINMDTDLLHCNLQVLPSSLLFLQNAGLSIIPQPLHHYNGRDSSRGLLAHVARQPSHKRTHCSQFRSLWTLWSNLLAKASHRPLVRIQLCQIMPKKSFLTPRLRWSPEKLPRHAMHGSG
jgi:hypothetical protein